MLEAACVLAAPMLMLAGAGSGQAAVIAASFTTVGSTPATATAHSASYPSAKDPTTDARPPVDAQGSALTSAEAQSLLEASAKERVADILATTPTAEPGPARGKSSEKFKLKRDGEKPIVAARKERLKGFGFYYSSASTTIKVVDIYGTATEATVKFDEASKMYMSSYTTGPSSTPEETRVRQTARFLNTGFGWVLDDWTPDEPQGLPTAIVDHNAPAANLSTEIKAPKQQVAPGQVGAVPGVPGNTKPKAGTASAAAATTTDAKTVDDYTAMLASYGYNYEAMLNYVAQYWYYYNPNYKAYGSDCTNFVSQALGAGGWGMVDNGTWYTDNNNWYYYPWVATRSWTSVEDFFAFATRGSGRTYELSHLNSMGPADLEIVDWYGDGSKDHAMMVTYWAAGGGWAGYNDIRVTYHTNDTRNISIWSLYTSYPGGTWFALRT